MIVHRDVLDHTHSLWDLKKELEWMRYTIRVYGKLVLESRLTAYYGDSSYTYSGSRREPKPWTSLMQQYREIVEEYAGVNFNSCLANYYENGSVGLGLHRDDEPELGDDPMVATLSFGTPRVFLHEENGVIRETLVAHGDLIVMNGHTRHGIQKDNSRHPRVSLTFRNILT